MKRLTFLYSLIGLLLLSPGVFANSDDLSAGETAGPVTLRENIVVSGNYIRLADFFTNVPADKAQTAVAYAPKPGRRSSFDARWLFRVAQGYGLQWRPLSAELRATVMRDSITIEKDEIKDAVKAALSTYNLPSNPEVELSNKRLRVHVPAEIMAEVKVEDINYNNRSNRFAAIVAIGEKDMNASQRIRVTGQVHSMIEVPTLSRRLSKGDVIEEHDIAWVRLRADRTQRDILTDAQDLIGKTPKRLLRAERPIRSRDIQRPVLIPKGDIVTIVLKKPGMTLTAKGKAMEDGSDGETIRVVNTKTSRTIDAVVISSSTVTVLPLDMRPAQLAYNQ